MNFSDWLKKELSKRPGWTAGTLAQRARISRPAAYFYVSGERVPTDNTLAKIAAALEIDAATLPKFAPKASK
jgi:transcriptional regulator with XRE-family HTH domain